GLRSGHRRWLVLLGLDRAPVLVVFDRRSLLLGLPSGALLLRLVELLLRFVELLLRLLGHQLGLVQESHRWCSSLECWTPQSSAFTAIPQPKDLAACVKPTACRPRRRSRGARAILPRTARPAG